MALITGMKKGGPLMDALLEKRARKLCELRGLDPDENVQDATPSNYMVYRTRPRYWNVAEEITAFLQMQEAVKITEEDS